MRVPRPSPALIVACLALVVASAQPVAAAVSALVPTNSVGTAQLKDGAVTTSKLRDGAVTNRKIAPSTITGARIANGSVGLLDLAASARPTPPRAYAATSEVINLPVDGSFVTVVGLDLPAGSWVLIAKARANTVSAASGSETVICHLFLDDISYDHAIFDAQAGSQVPQSYSATLPATAVVTTGLALTHVEYACSGSGNNGLNSSVQAGKLVAIRVTL